LFPPLDIYHVRIDLLFRGISSGLVAGVLRPEHLRLLYRLEIPI
jgi:hypothetical protein